MGTARAGFLAPPAVPRMRRRWARLHVPRPIVATAVAGLVLTGLYAAAYVVLLQRDPGAAAAMLRMYGLTMLAGRETAMLDALNHGLPAVWVFVLSFVDDFGSLLVALPVFWLLVRALRARPSVRWLLARFEKQALRKRRLVARWGLPALALIYFLPGFGAGVPTTVLLAVLSRMPLRRLLPFFGVMTFAVDAAWAAGLARVSSALPRSPWVDAIPAFVVALVVGAGAVGAWRHRHERHVALLDLPSPPGQALEGHGCRRDGEMTSVDLDVFRSATHARERRMGVLLQGAELALVPGIEARSALALAQRGVAGVDGLASLDAPDLARLASDLGLQGREGALIAAARAIVDAQVGGWAPRRP